MKRLNIDDIVEFFLKMYIESFYHEDFQKLNEEKLNMLLKKMRLNENEIKINQKISCNLIKRKKYEEYLKIDNIEDLASNVNLMLNLYFEKYKNIHLRLLDGMMTTTKDFNNLLQEIDFFIEERVCQSHQKQIQESIKKSIKKCLEVLYYTKIIDKLEDLQQRVSFHIDLDDTEEKLFNKRLDEIDYM